MRPRVRQACGVTRSVVEWPARAGSPAHEQRDTLARKELSVEIIGTIIFGAVIGFLARLVLPGKQDINLIVTVILGILGALAGYYLWGAMGGGDTGGIDWIRWFISIAVAAALVVAYGAITGRRRA
jgi:uncharacterized membrane protein YeaQ/YmgE (transglycosylase-associated protein family)